MRHMPLIRSINLILALLQIPFGILFAQSSFESSKDAHAISKHLAFAAPYVYNIWWVLFLLSIGYSLYMLYSKKEQRKKDHRLGNTLCMWTSLGFLCSLLWMHLAKRWADTYSWPLLVIICLSYIFFFRAMLIVTKKRVKYSTWRYALKTAPICLYAGWLGLAIFISTGTVVDVHSHTFLGLSSVQATGALLCGATILVGFALYFTHAEISYLGAALWGLVGIYLGNFNSEEGRIIADTALGMMAIAITLYLWFRKDSKGARSSKHK